MPIQPKMLEYNATDAACTLEIRNAFWHEVAPDFEPAYRMTVDLYDPLMFMQTRGIKVNMPAMLDTKREILTAAAERQEELNKLVGRELNVNSSKQCIAYFYVELGIPPYYNNGSITVDDLALQRLSRGTAKRSGLRQAKLVQEIRGLQKLHGTYLDIEFDADERMRCSYNPRGTKFGRLSSSKTVFGTGTNTQNLPQEFKKFLEADGVFLEIDKRQAEWVVVAYLTGDANMLAVVESGQDTHIHTASLMFDAEKEIVEYDDKLIGSNTDPDLIAHLRNSDRFLQGRCDRFPRTMSARQCGKKSNHGLNYDEGFVQFALINEIEQRDAKTIVEMYHNIYPGIRLWYENVKRQLQKDRSLTNYFGRKVRFMSAWDTDLFKAAYSMLPQSTVVDSLNQGMVAIYRDDWLSSSKCLDISLAAQVHDSILTDVPVASMQSGEMVAAVKKMYDYLSPVITYNMRSFKIESDAKIGRNWGQYNKETNPMGMRAVKDWSNLPTILKELGL